MAALAWRALRIEGRRPPMLFCLGAVFCSFYGISDEWHQSFVPGLDASIGDWLANALGAVLAAAILFRRGRTAPKGTARA